MALTGRPRRRQHHRQGKVLNDDRADWREAWALFPGDVAYVWHGALHAGDGRRQSLEASGFAIRSQIIWDKTASSSAAAITTGSMSRLLVRRPQGQDRPLGRRPQPDHGLAIPHRKSASGHGTEKPVECMKRPIENNSSPGQAVYEPFSGSGTTIIAAEMTGRSCHAIELNPPMSMSRSGAGRTSPAAIFWMKTRAQWKETSVTELAGPPPKLIVRWQSSAPTAKDHPEAGGAALRVIDGDLAPALEQPHSFRKAT
jgi:hypothetical protein